MIGTHSAAGEAAVAGRASSYESSRSDVRAHVPVEATRILDLGCSSGALGAALKERCKCEVTGVERDPELAARAIERLDRVIVSSVEEYLAEAAAQPQFDCVIAADILEHLENPWAAMQSAAGLLAPGAHLVVSVPNVAHWRGLIRVAVEASWPRDDYGPFDRTHLRWFGYRDVEDLFSRVGLHLLRIEPRYWVSGWRLRVNQALARTRLSPVLPVQLIATGVKEAAA